MLTSALLAAFTLVAIPASRRWSGDYLSPPALVLAAWCGTLALFCARAFPYPPLHLGTRLLLGATIVLLTAGGVAGIWLARRAPVRERVDRPLPLAGWWVTGASLLGLAGVGWYFWSIVTILGWEALGDPIRIRGALHTYEIPSRFLFLQFFCLVASLLAFALWLAGTRLPRAALIGPVLCALATLVTTDRSQFFVLLLTSFFMYVFHHGRALRPTRFVLAAVVAVALLVTNFLAIGALLGKTAASWYLAGGGRSAPAAVADAETPPPPAAGVVLQLVALQVPPAAELPEGWLARTQEQIARQLRRTLQMYAYASASYYALDIYLQKPHPPTGGRHIFYPALRPFERLGLLATPLPSPIPPFEMAVPHPNGKGWFEFNAYTFLYYPLEDFGIAGALVYALVIGLACGWLFGWAGRDRSNAAGLLLVGHLSTALTLTVFVNKFNSTAWWYVLAATLAPFAVTRLSRLRRV